MESMISKIPVGIAAFMFSMLGSVWSAEHVGGWLPLSLFILGIIMFSLITIDIIYAIRRRKEDRESTVEALFNIRTRSLSSESQRATQHS